MYYYSYIYDIYIIYIVCVCFWNITLVVMPRYKLSQSTCKHSLLNPRAVSNCTYHFMVLVFFLHRLGSPLGTINGNKYLMNEWNDEDVRRCWLDCPQHLHVVVWQVWSFFFNLFILISWRLITSQYCSGFCHTLTWISHGFTCIPHPDPPSHLPLYPIPLGLPSAPGLSTCLMHPTWAGDLFHHR